MLGRTTVFIKYRVKVVCRRGLTVTRVRVSDRNFYIYIYIYRIIIMYTTYANEYFWSSFFFFFRGLKFILFVPFIIHRNYKDFLFFKYIHSSHKNFTVYRERLREYIQLQGSRSSRLQFL